MTDKQVKEEVFHYLYGQFSKNESVTTLHDLIQGKGLDSQQVYAISQVLTQQGYLLEETELTAKGIDYVENNRLVPQEQIERNISARNKIIAVLRQNQGELDWKDVITTAGIDDVTFAANADYLQKSGKIIMDAFGTCRIAAAR